MNRFAVDYARVLPVLALVGAPAALGLLEALRPVTARIISHLTISRG